MGVVSFFDILGTKKESAPDSSKNFIAANLALGDLFKTIASQKNQILYTTKNESTARPNYHSLVTQIAQKLVTSLQLCMSEQGFTQELTNNIRTLEAAIIDYKKNEMALSQIILVCSSIKMNLEKKI
jgi:hypothetical protein